MALQYSLDDLRKNLRGKSKKKLVEIGRNEGVELPLADAEFMIETLYEHLLAKSEGRSFAPPASIPASPPALESSPSSSPAGGGPRILVRIGAVPVQVRFRARHRFTRTWQSFAPDFFTAEEWAEIRGDKALVVREVD